MGRKAGDSNISHSATVVRVDPGSDSIYLLVDGIERVACFSYGGFAPAPR